MMKSEVEFLHSSLLSELPIAINGVSSIQVEGVPDGIVNVLGQFPYVF